MRVTNLCFDEEKHEYSIDGVVIPSVTHICRFLSQDGFKNVDPSVLSAAADRGTRIHEACMWHDFDAADCEANLDDLEVLPYIIAYANFKRDYQIKDWERIEYRMTNGFYAGTADRIGKIDGDTFVVDFKTGSKVNYHAAQAQTSAYAEMYYHELGGEMYYYGLGNVVRSECPYETAVLHLKKDESYTFRKLNHLIGLNAFNNCLNINHYLQRSYGNERPL